MTRMYIQPSFVDSCSSHGEWSGNNGQYRGDKSAEISTFINGRANVKAFSDEAIERNKAKVKPMSVTNSILLADRHLNRLEDMSAKLEEEYLSGEISSEIYAYARKTLDMRLEKAWRRVEKEKFSLFESLTEEKPSAILKTSKESRVVSGVLKGVSHDNCVVATMVAVSNLITKCVSIYRVIKENKE